MRERQTPRTRRARGTVAILAALAVAVSGLTGAPAFAAPSAPSDTAAVQPDAQQTADPGAERTQASLPVFGRRTVVSLTFDDGNRDQLVAAQTMDRFGLKGTFYVPTGLVGGAGFMTRAELAALEGKGHEIGGHTVNHTDLSEVSPDEAARQICVDRNNLLSWGFQARSFAYPFASSTAAVEQAAEDCGYNSGRLLADLRSPFDCDTCVAAETMPPVAPYATRALSQVDARWTLADLKRSVTNAERTGGWVQFTFHSVCKGCSELGVDPDVFAQFAHWLKLRSLVSRTSVRTVGDVMGGAVQPARDAPQPPTPEPGQNALVNADFEKPGAEPGVPACWMQGGWGTNTATFAAGTPRGGTGSSTVTVSGYESGDAKVLPRFDLGECTPTVAAGREYSLRTWFTSTTITQFAVYLRTTEGSWQYWTSSDWFAPSEAYAQAAWTTPPIPAGYDGISFGLSVFSDGSATVDDAAMYDAATAPPLTAAVPTVETPGVAPGDTLPDGPVAFEPTESGLQAPAE